MLAYNIFEILNTSYSYNNVISSSNWLAYTFISEIAPHDMYSVVAANCIRHKEMSPHFEIFINTYKELCKRYTINPATLDKLWSCGWTNMSKNNSFTTGDTPDFYKIISTSAQIIKEICLNNPDIIMSFKGIDYQDNTDGLTQYKGISKKDRIYRYLLKDIKTHKIIQSDWDNSYITYIIPDKYFNI